MMAIYTAFEDSSTDRASRKRTGIDYLSDHKPMKFMSRERGESSGTADAEDDTNTKSGGAVGPKPPEPP